MIYKDIHVSLMRFCSDFKVEASAAGFDLTPVYFDATPDDDSLPQSDVIGLSGLALGVDDGLIEVQCMIGISTLHDTNLFRMIDLVDRLFQKLQPDKIVKIFNADTGANAGTLKVMNGTRVMPVAGTTRPVQFVLVSLASSKTMPR